MVSSGNNVLVFNTGRTVKLADFGSAMHMDDVSSIGVGTLKGCSPHFAAPEVINFKRGWNQYHRLQSGKIY